ncbi:MAG: hypothetical protein HZB59_08530 [Ignavibacteriales bacterium]|nr:hypothetical protein [Ignavibacteriales bacterium]
MDSPLTSESKNLSIDFSFIGGTILIFHFMGAGAPSSWNWGFHHFGFLNIMFVVVGWLMMTVSLLPSIQQKIIYRLDNTIKQFSSLSRFYRRLILTTIFFLFALICWMVKEKIFLLGDGYLMLRILPTLQNVSDHYFTRNEPLPFILVGKLWQFLRAFSPSIIPEIPFIIISILSGLISLFFIWSIAKIITSDFVTRLLLALFFFASGGTQLFFGYVENYSLLYLFMLLFLWSSLKYLENEIDLLYPSVVYGFLFVSHFGVFIIAPALIVLYYHSYRANKIKEIVTSIGATIITIAALLWLFGYSSKIFTDQLFQSSNRFIQFTSGQDYQFISWGHLINNINIQILISPFALITVIILLPSLLKQIFKGDRIILFLSVIAAGGIVFTAVLNFRIGMSRDWDLIAPFLLGIIVLAGYAWNKIEFDHTEKNKLLTMIVIISIIHTAAWISVNANESASLKRFETLSDSRFWSKEAMLAGYEELAIYHRGRMDGENSLKYYKKYIQIDSSNTRILQGIAHVYFLMNNTEEEMKFLEKAVMAGAKNWDLFQRLGEANFETKQYSKAVSYFLCAISIDNNNPASYLSAGLAFRAMNDSVNMKIYIKSYLNMNPNTPDRSAVQKLIQEK